MAKNSISASKRRQFIGPAVKPGSGTSNDASAEGATQESFGQGGTPRFHHGLRGITGNDTAGAPKEVVRRDRRGDKFDDMSFVTGCLQGARSFRIHPGLYETAANRSLARDIEAACRFNRPG
jgi:hypothetical protein